MNNCKHGYISWVWKEVGNDTWDGEMEYRLEPEEVSWLEDIDLHRYYCTVCKEVFYYSEAARKYYEDEVYSNVLGNIK